MNKHPAGSSLTLNMGWVSALISNLCDSRRSCVAYADMHVLTRPLDVLTQGDMEDDQGQAHQPVYFPRDQVLRFEHHKQGCHK